MSPSQIYFKLLDIRDRVLVCPKLHRYKCPLKVKASYCVCVCVCVCARARARMCTHACMSVHVCVDQRNSFKCTKAISLYLEAQEQDQPSKTSSTSSKLIEMVSPVK